MSLRLAIRFEAEEDMAAARTWYDSHNTSLGVDFLSEVEATFDRILQWPEGYAVRHRQVRAAPVHRFPYVVYYRLLPDTIQILAVTHSRRHSRECRSRI